LKTIPKIKFFYKQNWFYKLNFASLPKQPATSNQQPATSNQQPANSKQQTANSKQSQFTVTPLSPNSPSNA